MRYFGTLSQVPERGRRNEARRPDEPFDFASFDFDFASLRATPVLSLSKDSERTRLESKGAQG